MITRSVACSSVSCGKGKTAFNNSRTLAVESAGKTSTANGRAKSGSRAYACAHANWVWATNPNANLVRAT